MLRLLLWLPACALPGAIVVNYVWRAPPRRDPARAVWGTFLLGMAAGIPADFVERELARLTGIADQLGQLASPTCLVFSFLFAAPWEEAIKVAAAWPGYRSGEFDEAFDGILYAVAASAGFAATEGAVHLSGSEVSLSGIGRTLLLLVAQPILSSTWGWALGKFRRTRIPTFRFTLLWLVATGLHGLIEHLTAARSAAALVAAVPLVLAMSGVAWWAGRDLLSRFERDTPDPSRRSALPQSFRSMRAALHRSDRPVLLHWIPLGALTTTGVMLVAVAAAILVGRRLGLDFSTIDTTDSAGTGPTAALAAAILIAFPVSGYLITRASQCDGVLEPALSAATAIVAVLVVLGLAAPVALVLALAFAPIAFALACGGAWLGLEK